METPFAFALPLLLVIGYIGYNMSEAMDREAYKAKREQNNAEYEKIVSDTATLRPYANQAISLVQCLEANEDEKPLQIQKLDTSEDKMLMLMLKIMTVERDTTIPYNKDNILCGSPSLSFMLDNKQPEIPEGDIIDFYTPNYFSQNDVSSKYVLRWYYNNFKGEKPQGYDVLEDIKKTNKNLEKLKYVASVFINAYSSPEVDRGKKGFNSGYVTAKVVVRDMTTQKQIEKYDIIATNSESIQFMETNHQTPSTDELNRRLVSDLTNNLRKAVKVSLRLEPKSNNALPF